MLKLKSTIIALMSIALSTSLVCEAQAATRYNADTQKFEEYTPGVRSGKGSSIKRQTVSYETNQRPGTIIIETSERRLYFVLGNGKAVKYGIGVGRDGFRWAGQNRISRKAEWPGWTPPAQMRKRVPDLPAYMPGGINNPLGARALYIGSTLYRVHGTSEPWTIGQAVSSGCIRLTNEDVTDLYERVKVGARVIVNR